MKLLKCLVILFLAQTAFANEWEFKSSETLEGLKSEKWKPLSNSGNPIQREFKGYIEYRTFIQWNPVYSQKAITLGKIGDADITYLNNSEIGRTGSFPPSFAYNMDTERLYYLPTAGLRNGKNEIKILVYTKYLVNKGFNPSNFVVDDVSKLDKSRYENELANNFSRLIIPILCLVLAIVSVPFLAPKHLWNNQLMIFLIGITSFVLGICRGRIGFHYFPILPVYKVTIISSILTMWLVTFFMTKKCKSSAKLIPAVLAIFLSGGILLSSTLEKAAFVGWNWFHIAPFFLMLALYGSLKENSIKSLKTWAVLILFVTDVNDSLHDLKVISTGSIMQYGLGLFILFMIVDQLLSLKKSWEKYFQKETELEIDAQLGRQAVQIAHDLTSPLITIKEVVNRLDNISLEEKAFLNNGIQRLTGISNSLLENKSVQRIQLSFPKCVEAVKSIIDEVKLKQDYENRIKFSFDVIDDNNEIFFEFNLDLFKRTLCNILTNAIEAIDSKGHIAIKVSNKFNSLRISIEDDGIGIFSNPENLFKRGYTTKKDGHGFGLSSAKEFIQNLNGEISIAPQNKGTIVSFSIPGLSFEKMSESSHFGLVLIDDDPLVRFNWKRQAKSLNMVVHSFSSFKEFTSSQNRFNENTPIFIDSNLGDGKGEELSETLFFNGFKKVYLTTANPNKESLSKEWIKMIIGKNFESAVMTLRA